MDSKTTTGWVVIREKDTITSYSRAVEGSDYREFKGETVLSAAFETVAEVLADVPRYPRWIFNCASIKVLKTMETRHHLIVYYQNHCPWPVLDRYAIVASNASTDYHKKASTILIHSIPQPYNDAPKTCLRMNSMYSKFIMTYVDPEHTHLTFEMGADPGGLITPAMANAFNKEHPYNTLKNLRKLVKEEKYISLGRKSSYYRIGQKFRGH